MTDWSARADCTGRRHALLVVMRRHAIASKRPPTKQNSWTWRLRRVRCTRSSKHGLHRREPRHRVPRPRGTTKVSKKKGCSRMTMDRPDLYRRSWPSIRSSRSGHSNLPSMGTRLGCPGQGAYARSPPPGRALHRKGTNVAGNLPIHRFDARYRVPCPLPVWSVRDCHSNRGRRMGRLHRKYNNPLRWRQPPAPPHAGPRYSQRLKRFVRPQANARQRSKVYATRGPPGVE